MTFGQLAIYSQKNMIVCKVATSEPLCESEDNPEIKYMQIEDYQTEEPHLESQFEDSQFEESQSEDQQLEDSDTDDPQLDESQIEDSLLDSPIEDSEIEDSQISDLQNENSESEDADLETENTPPLTQEEQKSSGELEEDEVNQPKAETVLQSTTRKAFTMCHFCGKLVSSVKLHIQRCHGEFKCIICLKSFKTKRELESHEELHGNNDFPCEVCHLSFKKAYDLAVHSKEHSGLKSLKCPLCTFRSASKPSMKTHIKHHEKDYRYYCDLCGRGFIGKSVYTEHVEAHSGVKRFQCDICNKMFMYSRYLKVHRKLNHKKILEGVEEINECHICRRRFSFAKSLIRHLNKIHNIGKDNSVFCPICMKKISNPYNLKMHMRTHTGEKPYVCECCGDTFSKKMYLKKHLHKHETLLKMEQQLDDDSHMLDVCN